MCLDQANEATVLDGLRYLPLNIMMCSHMIIVVGPTYMTRLWCVWYVPSTLLVALCE